MAYRHTFTDNILITVVVGKLLQLLFEPLQLKHYTFVAVIEFVHGRKIFYLLFTKLGARAVPGNTSPSFLIQPELARVVWKNQGLIFPGTARAPS